MENKTKVRLKKKGGGTSMPPHWETKKGNAKKNVSSAVGTEKLGGPPS